MLRVNDPEHTDFRSSSSLLYMTSLLLYHKFYWPCAICLVLQSRSKVHGDLLPLFFSLTGANCSKTLNARPCLRHHRLSFRSVEPSCSCSHSRLPISFAVQGVAVGLWARCCLSSMISAAAFITNVQPQLLATLRLHRCTASRCMVEMMRRTAASGVCQEERESEREEERRIQIRDSCSA
jgi:hypothetical protein